MGFFCPDRYTFRSLTCLLLLASLKTFPLLESSLGVAGTFYLLAALLLAALPAVYLCLPETKVTDSWASD